MRGRDGLRRIFPALLCALMAAAPAVAGEDGRLMRLGDEGIVFALPGGRETVFRWPLLLGARDDTGLVKLVDHTVAESEAALRYENGTSVTVRLDGQRAFSLSIADAPPGFTAFRLEAILPFALMEGGTWRLGDGPEQAFPRAQANPPHLGQASTRRFRLAGPAGDALDWTFPESSFLQLTDNRAWNWPVFALMAKLPNDGHNPSTVEAHRAAGGGHPAATRRTVDRFGQDLAVDWPGKVGDEAELRADVAADRAYFARAAFRPSGPVDRFGAPRTGAAAEWAGTGFFRLHREADGRWWLVTPDGNPFFSLALCSFSAHEGFTYIKGREDAYDWLPPREGPYAGAWHPEPYWNPHTVSFYVANWIRKYDEPFTSEAFFARMAPRARALGFNAVGAFGDLSPARARSGLPYMAPLFDYPLPYEELPGARGYFDPFDPEPWRRIDTEFARTVAARRDDPFLIAWYIGNEPAAEDVPAAVGRLPADRPAKRRLAEWLRERYTGDLARFRAAWKLDAADWPGLAAQSLVPATGEGAEDLAAFAELFFETYYGEMARLARRHDPNHLLAGHRWQVGGANHPALIRAAARHNDILSLNYYTYAFDTAYLERLRAWSGDKPFLFSEWHFSSPSDSGLPGGIRSVDSQEERAAGYRHYVEQAAALPYVVGTEWFTLVDQPRTGRYFEYLNGEMANTGFFSVVDRVYKPLAEAAAATNHGIYAVHRGKTPPFRFDDPRFSPAAAVRRTLWIPRADRPVPLDGSRDAWPKTPAEILNRQVLGQNGAPGQAATFRVCYDDTFLHLLLEAVDPTPMRNAREAEALWRGDAVELFFGPDDPGRSGAPGFGDRHLLFGAATDAGAPRTHQRLAPSGPSTPLPRTAVFPRPGGYILQAAIPFAALGIDAPRGGEAVSFDVGLDDSEDGRERVRQFMWSGDDSASRNRGVWGRAVFAPYESRDQ